VSPTRGRQIVRQAPPKRLERPSLDRPSLFAGMEAGDSIVPEDDDGPRGGILSTLESVRQRKPLHGRGDAGSPPSGGLWQNRILWGVMGAGVVALLGSFAMIVSEGHSRSMAIQEAAIERAVLARAPAPVTREVRDLNVLAAPAAGGMASASAPMVAADNAVATPNVGAATGTATIVEAGLAQPGPVPVGVVPTPALKAAAAPVSPVPPMPDISPLSPAATAAPVAAQPPMATDARATAAVTSNTSTLPAAPVAPPRAATPVMAKAQEKIQDKTLDKPASARSKRKHQDEDVALLEAMFQHAQTRVGAPAAGPSVADQLKRHCSTLSGAAAATCRARICVSNPSAAVCHDSP
jgi:hypothetical protein